jgi:hypothetical protein
VTPVEVAPVELKLAPDTELEIMLEAELGLILNVELVLVRRLELYPAMEPELELELVEGLGPLLADIECHRRNAGEELL